MRRLLLSGVALVIALTTASAVLASADPKTMALTLTDVQSIPDQSGFGNLAGGFVAKTAKASGIKSRKYGRIKSYESELQNRSLPDGYESPTLRMVTVNSEAFVYQSAALAAAHWKKWVADYDSSPPFDEMGRPKVGK